MSGVSQPDRMDCRSSWGLSKGGPQPQWEVGILLKIACTTRQGQWHLGSGDTGHSHVGTEKEAKVKESTWRLNTVSIPWGQPEMI